MKIRDIKTDIKTSNVNNFFNLSNLRNLVFSRFFVLKKAIIGLVLLNHNTLYLTVVFA